MTEVTRRQFVIGSAAAIACAGGWRTTQGALSSPIQRKDIRDLSPDELDKYQEAFRRLKAIGPERPTWMGIARTMPVVSTLNKRGYAFQASLHTTDCPHGNWWFLPWHRVYLYYFEKILRNVVADYKPSVPLALPYWDWTTQRAIPTAFTADPATNPLFDDRRFSRALNDADVGAATIRRTVDLASSFTSFGSRAFCQKRQATNSSASPFEAGPHGIVHVKVGWYDSMVSMDWPNGRPGTFRDPPTAAYDPIFWSHHANIDRLWDYWLSRPGHRNPAFNEQCPGGTVTWGGLRFREFVDVGGVSLDHTVEEFLTSAEIRNVVYLGRTGTPLIAAQSTAINMKPEPEITAPAAIVANARPVLQLGKPVTLGIGETQKVAPHLRSVMANDKSETPLLFEVQGVVVPKTAPPVLVRAFLNKPDVTADTSVDDPHYIGYFTFFDTGHGHDDHAADGDAPHGQGFLLNLTPTIQALGKEIDPTKPLSVSLVLLPIDDKTPPSLQQLQLPFESGRLLIRPALATP